MLDMGEDAKNSWREYLADFEREIWPVFAARGFSKDAALVAWMTNRLYNDVDALVAQLSDDRDEGEEWKG